MPHIVIAGAGIGGLTAAIALARTGIRVTLFERKMAIEELGAGLQLSPNATRVLAKFGLLDEILAESIQPEAVRIRRGADGREIATMPFGESAIRRYGAPFALIHRADLQRILAKRAIETGIEIAFGARVLNVAHDTKGVGLTIETRHGEARSAADGFVAADGLRSMARAPTNARELPAYSGRVAWRALVPAASVPASFTRPESNLWLGTHTHLVHYPLRGGTIVNVVAIVDDKAGRSPASGDLWSQPGDPALLRPNFQSWDAAPRKLMEAAERWHIWPLFDRSPDIVWSDRAATLLGDAAHPMLPFLAQGASQAIEDAACLASEVRRSSGDLGGAFRRYEAVRRPHTARVQRESRRQAVIYHLPRPASDARDIVMRALGPDRLLARMDWLYGRPMPPCAP